ncbi:MAG: pyruvate kinase [Candidatus Omnitrophica bacterium]|nr:pyruvate kinase [Candidatus Omnitrophota bacterium]
MRSKVKIIATLGPATDSEGILRKMTFSGLDVVRLNFSHGTLSAHKKRLDLVRKINKKYRRALKVIQDLEGYRIRIGRLKKEIMLRKHSILHLTQEDIVADAKVIPFDYLGSLSGIAKGNSVYIDDGKITLKVLAKEKKRLKVQVIIGGILKEHKGVNIPEAYLDFEALTEKDRTDIGFACEEKIEFLAQSFVRSAKDIELLRSLLQKRHPSCKIIAKIESRESVVNIDEIIARCDAIMIARGDMGVCFPIYKVPVLQKEIIKKCKLARRPVIVATQMLDSMTEEILPTRAEASDVANAVIDGADFLMLSSETAVGKYPDKAVEMMDKIIKNTEAYQRNLAGIIA